LTQMTQVRVRVMSQVDSVVGNAGWTTEPVNARVDTINPYPFPWFAFPWCAFDLPDALTLEYEWLLLAALASLMSLACTSALSVKFKILETMSALFRSLGHSIHQDFVAEGNFLQQR
jgi:hypothetical protein